MNVHPIIIEAAKRLANETKKNTTKSEGPEAYLFPTRIWKNEEQGQKMSSRKTETNTSS